MENYGGLIEGKEDNRDFQAEHILGSNEYDIPDGVDLSCVKPMNQGKTNHCTAYGLTMVHSILQTSEHGKEINLSPEEQWENQLEYPATATEEIGDYLRSALKSLTKFGLSNPKDEKPIMFYSKGFAVIKKDPVGMCRAIAKGLPLYTGGSVTKTNFRNAKYKGAWTGNDGKVTGGHAFMIVGYNLREEYFTAINSWGAEWGFYKNGTFRIPFSNAEDLHTTYVLYDKEDLRHIFRDVTGESPMAEAIEYCLAHGIMRGYGDGEPEERLFKPDQPVTRAELAQVIFNQKK